MDQETCRCNPVIRRLTCSLTSSEMASSAYGIPSSALCIFSYTLRNFASTVSLSSA